jgi:predicted alpha/beta-fold hydrolase
MNQYRLRPFRSAWRLPGAHAQTIVGRFLRRRLRLPLHRERIETPDGDFLDLDFADNRSEDQRVAKQQAPRVLILHGLEGSSQSGYVLHTLQYLAQYGLRGVALNFRSCSGEPNRSARFYHAGDTDDVALVVDLLARRFPDAPLGAIGFSLGGNMLLKYLGERGEAAAQQLAAAVAVSVPFDLAAGAVELEGGMGRVYTSYFMRRLLRKSRDKADLIGDRCDASRISTARTLREFDDAATAPLHGFRDAAHYYAESSSFRYLGLIRVPTLLLHSTDDPFLSPSAVPHETVRGNPFLVDGFTATGGHVGFVGGAPWAPEFWAEREAARFVAAQLLSNSRAISAAPDHQNS